MLKDEEYSKDSHDAEAIPAYYLVNKPNAFTNCSYLR